MTHNIVAVDDDVAILKNIRTLIGGGDLKVSAVRSGRELLAFMEKHDPDLILLDVMMPELDGFETFKLLRDYEEKAGKTPTPVIFLTGASDTDTERKGLEIGAADFISKPFNRDIMLKRIHNTIMNTKKIETLQEEASYDQLTGFLNKANTGDRMNELCNNENGSLMIIDLDNFKLVNDIYGHDMGDKVLSAFADIVRQNTRSHDVLCRIGGDEFLIFCKNLLKESAVSSITKRLNERLVSVSEELMGENFGIPIGVSVGAVFVPESGRDYDSLFQLADKALYKVKQNGKHGFSIYGETKGKEDSDEELPMEELLQFTKVLSERGGIHGSFEIGQDAFMAVYRFISRLALETGMSVQKLLFILKLKPGEVNSDEVLSLFWDMLKKNLRVCDPVIRLKSNQFFALLPRVSRGEAELLGEKIQKEARRIEGFEAYECNYFLESIECKALIKS